MTRHENQLLKTYINIKDEPRPVAHMKITKEHAEELAKYYNYSMDEVKDLFEVVNE